MSIPLVKETVTAPPLSPAPRKVREGFGSISEKLPELTPLRRKLAVGVLLLLTLAAGSWLALSTRPVPQTISYTELLRAIDAGQVGTLTVRPGQDVRGHWVAPAAGVQGGAGFMAVFPLETVDEITTRAEAANVEVTLQRARSSRFYSEIFSYSLQFLLLSAIGFLLYLHFRGQQGSNDLGKAGLPQTTFGDVAGTQGASEDLQELVEFLRNPGTFASVGARIPKGALLVGPPGTGKTLLARAVAGEAGVPFFSISGSEVTGFLVGLGSHRIKSLFKKARKNGGVIFIDEIDALGGKRGRNQAHNEDDRTLNQLLVEMDGFSPSEGVVVIAATNRPEDLDPALKRPGRFDRTITVGLPTSDGREAILRLHARRRGIPLHEDVDFGRLARLTPGASGAELANLLNEAAIVAGRSGCEVVRWSDFEVARDRMLLGKERVGFKAVDQEWNTVAYHEAGHALAGVVCAPEDGLHKVTIQPRGQAMGVAFFSPDSDRFLYRKSYLEGQIIKGLAGRAAEEIVFGADAITSGAQSDLVHVNGIARKMVFHFGMGAETGLLVHDGQPGSISPEAHARMDREVRELLDRLYARAVDVLRTNRHALQALAEALLERETLDGAEAVALLEEHGLVRQPFGPQPENAGGLAVSA